MKRFSVNAVLVAVESKVSSTTIADDPLSALLAFDDGGGGDADVAASEHSNTIVVFRSGLHQECQ